MKKNVSQMLDSFLYLQRYFGIGQWSFLGPGSEKKWYFISADSPQGERDRIAEKMMLEFGESRHPVFRATSPLSRGTLKSKGGGKLSIHYCDDLDTIKTVFRTITSVNQLSLYGAVAEMCEEYETFHDGTGQRQKFLWIVMTVLTKIFYCKDTENELKSYHNKTN